MEESKCSVLQQNCPLSCYSVGRMYDMYATEEVNVRAERLSRTRKYPTAAVMGGGKGGFSIAMSRDV